MSVHCTIFSRKGVSGNFGMVQSSESLPTKLFIDFEMFYGDAKLAATATRDKENRDGGTEAAMRRLINACEKELEKEMGKIGKLK